MRTTTQAPDDVLAPYPVEAITPRVIAQRLRESGLIVVDGLTRRSDVRQLALLFMNLYAHRDSDPDGITTIRNNGSTENRPGFEGFASGPLAPHTERSGIPTPPRLMFMACARPADRGGECLLTDGRELYNNLWTHRPEAAVALSEPRTAFYGMGDGAGGGHAAQVFTRLPGGRIAVRLRLDALARWSPMVEPYLRDLRAAALQDQVTLPLAAGQAYILDNTRWLHARGAFSGDRRFWRVLGDPRFPLPTGFLPINRTTTTAAEVARTAGLPTGEEGIV
ncbi:TauD/TfdA family dioxygenase [Actinomadura barringtoniae]|uniref:TauD/TfdA family dioxygenase n=1 Tax=Actinomadura barringtoniae TaxID=1427535 RepID=A0A939T9F1_9ACTN|nr:TauD/TfdA family dioxygenase [Actinomadura barringtoniae]MBO2454194.1 TauD/TfdA family dioxygenase [Actinomadura barringtoniae]